VIIFRYYSADIWEAVQKAWHSSFQESPGKLQGKWSECIQCTEL